MIPAGVRQMDQQDHFDDAEDRSGTTRASPTYLRVGTVPVGTKKRPAVKQRNECELDFDAAIRERMITSIAMRERDPLPERVKSTPH
jgi:hypothetical protein